MIAFVTSDHAPVPAAFTAATLNVYPVPLVSPVTVAAVAVEAFRLNGIHVVPLFVEYSTV